MFMAKSPQKLFRQKAYDFNGLADSLQHPFILTISPKYNTHINTVLPTCQIIPTKIWFIPPTLYILLNEACFTTTLSQPITQIQAGEITMTIRLPPDNFLDHILAIFGKKKKIIIRKPKKVKINKRNRGFSSGFFLPFFAFPGYFPPLNPGKKTY